MFRLEGECICCESVNPCSHAYHLIAILLYHIFFVSCLSNLLCLYKYAAFDKLALNCFLVVFFLLLPNALISKISSVITFSIVHTYNSDIYLYKLAVNRHFGYLLVAEFYDANIMMSYGSFSKPIIVGSLLKIFTGQLNE